MAKKKALKRPARRRAVSRNAKTSAAETRPRSRMPAVDPLANREQQHTPSEIEQLTNLAVQFRDERDWKQFHNPKDMALSMALEAAEIIELMQWKNGDALRQHLAARRGDLADELSDVLYWVLTIAHDFNIDLPAAFRHKLEKSALKYPIEKSRGRSDKYTEL